VIKVRRCAESTTQDNDMAYVKRYMLFVYDMA